MCSTLGMCMAFLFFFFCLGGSFWNPLFPSVSPFLASSFPFFSVCLLLVLSAISCQGCCEMLLANLPSKLPQTLEHFKSVEKKRQALAPFLQGVTRQIKIHIHNENRSVLFPLAKATCTKNVGCHFHRCYWSGEWGQQTGNFKCQSLQLLQCSSFFIH